MPIQIISDSFFPTNKSQSFPTEEKIKFEVEGIVDLKSAKENIILRGPNASKLRLDNSTIITETFSDYEILKTNIEIKYYLNDVEVFALVDKSSADKSVITVEPYNTLEEKTEYILYVNGVNGSLNNTGLSEMKHSHVISNGAVDENIKVFGSPKVEADTFLNIKIVQGGIISKAKFVCWIDGENEPALTKSNLNTTSGRWKSIGEGLSLKFVGGEYEVGDLFRVNLYTPIYLENTYKLIFSTGDDSLTTAPAIKSTSPLPLDVGEIGTQNLSDFRVIKITPNNGEINVSKNIKEIVVEFNKDIDASSVSRDLKILAQPVKGFYSGANKEIKIPRVVRVDGNKLYLEI